MSESCECCMKQVEVPATGRSLLQFGPTKCGASECHPGKGIGLLGLSRHENTEQISYLAVLFLHVSAPTLAVLHTVYWEKNLCPVSLRT